MERVSSSPLTQGQRGRRIAGATAAALGLFVMLSGQAVRPDGRPTPSSYPVPRWITLKADEVHARKGPGLDHQILWTYQVAGLPVQVVAETFEWRKICDPEGSLVWVHRSTTSGRRTVLNRGVAAIEVRSARREDASIRARLSPHALVPITDCEDGWCEVRSGRVRGWVREAAVFGTQASPLCEANRPAGPAPRRR